MWFFGRYLTSVPPPLILIFFSYGRVAKTVINGQNSTSKHCQRMMWITLWKQSKEFFTKNHEKMLTRAMGNAQCEKWTKIFYRSISHHTIKVFGTKSTEKTRKYRVSVLRRELIGDFARLSLERAPFACRKQECEVTGVTHHQYELSSKMREKTPPRLL